MDVRAVRVRARSASANAEHVRDPEPASRARGHLIVDLEDLRRSGIRNVDAGKQQESGE